MSNRPKDGGCAFPFNAGEFGIEPSVGMSLRDWFAGQALSGLATADGFWVDAAKLAYRYADDMLLEREARSK